MALDFPSARSTMTRTEARVCWCNFFFTFFLWQSHEFFAKTAPHNKKRQYYSFLFWHLIFFSAQTLANTNKIKMVAGVFVYPHLFSPRRNKCFWSTYFGLTHDFLNHLAVVLLAGATLSPWEELFRHTGLSPSREKIKWVVTAPPVNAQVSPAPA